MLSVIVPVYNVEKYLRQCLDSIVNQTYKDLEIVIVNDGSTDNSLSIIKEYAALDNRIKVIDKENGGLVSAYTMGFKYATGEYITFVDSDDWCELDMYSQMMPKFSEYNIDLVICAYDRVREGESNKVDLGISEGLYSDKEKFYYKINQNFISAARWNKIFKKSLLTKIFNNLDKSVNFAEDTMLTIPYMQKVNNYYYLDKVLYHYRVVDNSISTRFNENAIFDVTKVNNAIRRFDFDYNDDLLNQHSMELYTRLLANIMSLRNLSERKKYFKILVSEPLFKKVKKCKGWHCTNSRQRIQKFFYKYMPMVYLKLSTLKRKLKG